MRHHRPLNTTGALAAALVVVAIAAPGGAEQAGGEVTLSRTTMLADGREVALQRTVFERRTSEDPVFGLRHSMRFELVLTVRAPGRPADTVARWAMWGRDLARSGKSSDMAVLPTDDGKNVQLISCTGAHDGITVSGGRMSLERRAAADEFLPDWEYEWTLWIPRGPQAVVPSDVRFASVGSLVVIWIAGGGKPISELAIDPQARVAHDLLRGPVSADWEWRETQRALMSRGRTAPAESPPQAKP